MGNSPRYVGYLDPPYVVALQGDSGSVIDLTGATSLTLLMVNTDLGLYKTGAGTWTILSPATAGRASYQWDTTDLNTTGVWHLYFSAQLPGEVGKREFDPDPLLILSVTGSTVIGSGGSVATQDVNLIQINGTTISNTNPLPTSLSSALPAGSAVIGHVIVDSAGNVTITSLPALPAGTNVIGHVIVDSASNVTITSLPSLPAGSNTIGNVGLVAGSALVGGAQIVDSGGTNKASVSAGGAVKVDNSAVTQPVSGTVTANVGTTNGLALDASVNGVLVSQGSTTSGEKGPLVQGAVTTAAPTYTTGQTSPVSLTPAGAMRVDASATTQPVSAASLPLPSGASTAAKQPALGTAGTASSDVVTVQGIASMTPVKVDGSAVTQPVSGTVTANQGGTWTVQPGNTANSTAWLVDASDRWARLLGQVDIARVLGAAISATNAVPVSQGQSATSTLTNVTAAASDTSLLASNTSRKAAYFYNDSTAILYLEFGSGAASTTNYTVQLPAQSYYEMPTYPIYTGAIRGIWSAANGAVRITELS